MLLSRVVAEDSFLEALIALANTSADSARLLCCAKVMANLSGGSRGRAFMGLSTAAMANLLGGPWGRAFMGLSIAVAMANLSVGARGRAFMGLSTAAMANLSGGSRGRAFMGLSTAVVPCLVSMMRSGVKEAARVQYYCAVALCNVLSVAKLKDALAGATNMKTGEGLWLQDLIAVTVLRVNEVSTKEVLSRALFNLLTRAETRRKVVDQGTTRRKVVDEGTVVDQGKGVDQGTVFALIQLMRLQSSETNMVFALIQLTRLQSSEMNTVCMRAIYNLTCELPEYQAEVEERDFYKVIMEQASFPNGGTEVRRLCGAALANLSAHPATCQVLPKHPVVSAVRAAAGTGLGDTLEHCAICLFNISRLPVGRIALALQGAGGVVPALNETGAVVVKTLCVATLANVSCTGNTDDNRNCYVDPAVVTGVKPRASTPASSAAAAAAAARSGGSGGSSARGQRPATGDAPGPGMLGGALDCLCTAEVMAVLCATLSAAHMSLPCRLDALHTMCNMVTRHVPSRYAAASAGCCTALCTMLKALSSDAQKVPLSKCFRELVCEPACCRALLQEGLVTALSKLAKCEMAEEGLMTELSRLAKCETAEVKQDVASALCRLSTQEAMLTQEALLTALAEHAAEVVEAMFWLTLEDLLGATRSVLLRMAIACRNMAAIASRNTVAIACRNIVAIACRNMVTEERCVTALCAQSDRFHRVLAKLAQSDRFHRVLAKLAQAEHAETRLHVAMVFLTLTASRAGIPLIAKGGLIASMSRLVEGSDERVRQVCATALNQLPQEMVQLDEKLIKSLQRIVQLDEKLIKVLVVTVKMEDGGGLGEAGVVIAETAFRTFCDPLTSPYTPSQHPQVLVAMLKMEDGGALGEAGTVIADPPSQDLKPYPPRPTCLPGDPALAAAVSWVAEIVGEGVKDPALAAAVRWVAETAKAVAKAPPANIELTQLQPCVLGGRKGSSAPPRGPWDGGSDAPPPGTPNGGPSRALFGGSAGGATTRPSWDAPIARGLEARVKLASETVAATAKEEEKVLGKFTKIPAAGLRKITLEDLLAPLPGAPAVPPPSGGISSPPAIRRSKTKTRAQLLLGGMDAAEPGRIDGSSLGSPEPSPNARARSSADAQRAAARGSSGSASAPATFSPDARVRGSHGVNSGANQRARGSGYAFAPGAEPSSPDARVPRDGGALAANPTARVGSRAGGARVAFGADVVVGAPAPGAAHEAAPLSPERGGGPLPSIVFSC
ncbi:hypothetical protein JKP88DRAFT_280747 [Tribonema minus]|uniref:Uncharacterized protein n=1 Tax=Tribonema minus TaxID=303371 RepID=A0A835YYM6_9STRA|nr:hypothetical protein JKP88DRAFT_280747 [Tribonema minus]